VLLDFFCERQHRNAGLNFHPQIGAIFVVSVKKPWLQTNTSEYRESQFPLSN